MPMTEVYAGEHVRKREMRPSIYIEGRDEVWLQTALEYLKAKRFQGMVYIPRTREGEWADDDEVLYGQKLELIEAAQVVAFWIPDYATAEPYTSITMLHLGLYAKSKRAVLGFPDGLKYSHVFDRKGEKRIIPVFFTMQEVLGEALRLTRQ